MVGEAMAELCAASWDSDLAQVGLPCVGLHTRAAEEARVKDDAGGAGPTSVMSCSASRRGAGVVVVVVGK